MGFLLGAFGKQMAGTRYRSLQARMMKIQGKVRRIHRAMEHMQNCIEREKKSALNALSIEEQATKSLYQTQLSGVLNGVMSSLGLADAKTMTTEQSAAYNAQVASQQALKQAEISRFEASMAQRKKEIEDYYEDYKEQHVEPLKDEEEDLTSEKEMLEGQVALAKEDYEACKKMEQADIKMLTPNYTGQA